MSPYRINLKPAHQVIIDAKTTDEIFIQDLKNLSVFKAKIEESMFCFKHSILPSASNNGMKHSDLQRLSRNWLPTVCEGDKEYKLTTEAYVSALNEVLEPKGYRAVITDSAKSHFRYEW